MEGCVSCYFWGRLAKSHRHEVRIIAPERVKSFLQGQKTDANDALAIGAVYLKLACVLAP